MGFNWTLEELMLLLSLFLMIAAIIISYYQYLKTNHRTFLFLVLTWVSISFFTLFEILSYVFLSIPIFQFRIFFVIIGGFFLIMCVDSFSRYNVDPIKTTIFGILSTLLIITSYIPGSIEPYTFSNGDKSFSSKGSLVFSTSLVFAFIEIMFLSYSIKLYLHSSSKIKKYALLNLFGAVIFGIIPTITMAFRLTLIIPGCGFIATSLGAVISSIAFAIQPKLRDVLLKISRDIRIQMRQQLEDQISEKELQYQALYSSMSEGVTVNRIISDNEGHINDYKIEGINPAYEKLFNTTKTQVIGKKGSEIFPENFQIFINYYNKAKKEEKPQVLEVTFQEIKKTFYVSIFLLSKEEEFAKIFMDITAEKREEEERIKNDKIKSIGELAGGLAHDFNNLLTSIIGNIQLAQLSNPKNEEIFDFLNDAENAAMQGKDLANHFLTFAKGGAPIKKTLHIEKLLRDGARISLIGSNVKAKFNISEDLWLTDCDGGQIQQAFNNLLINAKEAMPEGGNIEICAKNENLNENSIPLELGRYIKISIRDHGIGIPRENIKRIFDPFFSTKMRKDQQGMGLGLTTTYTIIKRHNGHLNVRSQVGIGTTFEIYLPASEKQETDHNSIKTSIIQGKGHILLMDDEEKVREVARRLLNHLGYDVKLVSSGEEAIEIYKKNSEFFDLVMLDLTVRGGLGGLSTLEELKKINPNIKTIVISGYSNDPVLSNHQNYGFNGKIEKPFDVEAMSKVISDILNN